MQRVPELARQLYDRFEPVHAVTYFAPEARAAMDNLASADFGQFKLSVVITRQNAGQLDDFKALAIAELKGGLSSSEQAKLGDGWWDLAEKQDAAVKKQIELRAGYWYDKALPGLRGLICSDFRATPTDAPDTNRGVAIEFGTEAGRDEFLRRIEAEFGPRRFTNAADAFDIEIVSIADGKLL